jgi:phage-related protein
MFSLILENKNGDQLSFGMGSPFTIEDIQGLNPPNATINTSQISLIDGGKYNSAKVNMRQLLIAFAIEYSAAYNRIQVYNVLKSKQWVRMYYSGDYRDVYIDGYIQSIGVSHFEMKQVVTVSILCPSPFFKEAQVIVNELKNIFSAFHFPFSSTEAPQLVFGYFSNDMGITIENDGDIDCGMIIELYARSPITNPKIFNYITKEFIGLNYSMQTADLITIDTNKGQKTVTLLRNGVETNLFNYVMQNSTWLQLDASGSTFVYEVSSGMLGDLLVTFKHYNLYEGV